MSYYHSSILLQRTRTSYIEVSSNDIVFDNGNGIGVIELKNPDIIEKEVICNQHEVKFFEFNFLCPDIFKSQEKQYALLSAMQSCPSGWQPSGEPRRIEGDTWGVVIHRWNQIL